MNKEQIDKLNLKISISPGSGFCSGVIRAIHLAEELLDKGEEVYCVGKIVHNDEEISRLEKKGLHVVSLEDLSSLHHKNILFRAHGEPPSSYKLALQNQNHLFDASCKIVLKIQDKIRISLEKGEHVVIYGKKNHPEVLGMLGQGSGKIILIGDISEAENIMFPSEVTLFSQTTKSQKGFYELLSYLEKRGIKVQLQDTICRQVHNREEKLAEFAGSQDVIIFVAGKDSSNGKVLFDLCKSVNTLSYYISSENEIEPSWFKYGNKVGIAGATSTPLWLLQQVKDYLQEV